MKHKTKAKFFRVVFVHDLDEFLSSYSSKKIGAWKDNYLKKINRGIIYKKQFEN